MYTKIHKCRICNNENLVRVLDLGVQALTGVFPKIVKEVVTSGPISLVKCHGNNSCGLLQLEHSYDLSEMYGHNYGYRSGLNASMVKHLHGKVKAIQSIIEINENDLVIDIGSNDSTTLQAYPENLKLVGVDPTGIKFHRYYPNHIQLIPDFFSSKLIKDKFGSQKAKVITSFSMFYDLEDPVAFMKEVYEVLDDDGIWVFEQSYMPAMLKTNSYDTVCHEHLEFYALKQIKWMTDKVGFKIVDVTFNDVNGGSFSISVQKSNGKLSTASLVDEILKNETLAGLDDLNTYKLFSDAAINAKNELLNFLMEVKQKKQTVVGLGASTKGNVLLQYCEINSDDLAYIAEVNEEKYGAFTPGTLIPIKSEDTLSLDRPDYLLVLPWHFRDFFMNQEKYREFNLVFPLPKFNIVNKKNSF